MPARVHFPADPRSRSPERASARKSSCCPLSRRCRPCCWRVAPTVVPVVVIAVLAGPHTANPFPVFAIPLYCLRKSEIEFDLRDEPRVPGDLVAAQGVTTVVAGAILYLRDER